MSLASAPVRTAAARFVRIGSFGLGVAVLPKAQWLRQGSACCPRGSSRSLLTAPRPCSLARVR